MYNAVEAVIDADVIRINLEEAPAGWFVGSKVLASRLVPKHDSWQDIAEEAVGFATTVGRYACTAFPMARRAKNGDNIVGYGIAAIIGDVADGEVTRWVTKNLLYREAEDTPIRRILDGVLDQVTVLQVGREIVKRNRAAIPYLAAIGLRSIIAGGGLNGIHLIATGEVTKGKKVQKATNLTAGLFGIAAANGNPTATHVTGIVATLTAWATVPRHLQEFRQQRGRVFRELR